jgi:hypothetical protein
MVRRLDRVARFLNVRELENPDGSSPLAGKLVMELVEGPPGAHWHDAERRRPLAGGVVRVGETIGLLLRNDADVTLNVVVLDLQPDWGVSIAYPCPKVSLYDVLAPGDEIVRPLEVTLPLPDRVHSAQDGLKAIASVEPLDCSWLVLPALGASATRTRGGASPPRGAPETPLERLFAALGGTGGPRMRSARPATVASHAWTVAQLEATVVRPRS